MAVEDHPKYPEWLKLSEQLIEAIEAKKAGNAVAIDVIKARKAMDRFWDEFDA